MDTRYPEGSVREQANVRDVRATVKQRCDCGTVTETLHLRPYLHMECGQKERPICLSLGRFHDCVAS